MNKPGSQLTVAERAEAHNRNEKFADEIGRMFARGASYGDISTATGVPRSTVAVMCKRLSAAYVRDRYGDITSALGRELQILDMLTQKNLKRAADGDTGAAKIVLDAHIRRSKLLGLDAAVKAELTVKNSTDIEIERLVRMMSETPIEEAHSE